ncbi:hypothetical protein, partial [Mucilaginibacter arboris]|uniref:hypothetical protein n=1 Tax=Mucilaginibacter arboris TaxID=2682090 RepID=UPI001E5C0844
MELSDRSNTKEVLTLIVHKKNFSKNYNRFYKNLKNQTIDFTGRVKKTNGRNVVFTEADTLKINFEIEVVQQ